MQNRVIRPVAPALAIFFALSLPACDGGDGPVASGPGAIEVSLSVTGTDPDALLTLSLDGGAANEIAPTQGITFAVDAGAHTVALGGVASNCAVAGAGTAAVTVSPGRTATVSFAVSCSARQLAFHSNVDGDYEIYRIDRLGANLVQLTSNAATDVAPEFSPDGRRIAFTSFRDGNAEVYVMNADGSAQTRLTASPLAEDEPTWSPDGSRLAYVSAGVRLMVMNADGTGSAQLADLSGTEGVTHLSWSPDGTRIAFTVAHFGPGGINPEVYVATVAGGAVTRLTSQAGEDWYPAWTPDGRRIVFSSARDGGAETDLYEMGADGSAPVRLLARPGTRDSAPDYAPDGGWLAFVSIPATGPGKVWVRSPSGELTQVTTGAGSEGFPDWRP